MSYQQGQPTPGQQQPQQPPEQPQKQMTPQELQDAEADRILQEILGGEIPGMGYLTPVEPRKRDEILIPTDPDKVRSQILRSIETMAIALQLPYGAEKKGEIGKSLLEAAQAYLLLDPTVDENGVPVGAQAQAQGEAQSAAAQAQGESQQAVNAHQAQLDQEGEEHKALLEGHVAAHQSGQDWSFPVTKGGHPEPPRIKPNPAEEAIAEKNNEQSEELKGARGDKPLPKPRVGA